jgi:iron complex outermembrane receptor protein
MSLEELLEVRVDSVIGASRHEQRIVEAPSSVTIILDDEIQKQGYRTLADVLRSVRGLYVSNDRNYSYLGFRGFSRPSDYNSRVLLLVNGHRINDNLYDSAFIGREAGLDVDLIDRVEIIRGPSSSMYGNNAFFGVINVITKDPATYQGGEVAGAAGSWDSYQGRFTYGRAFDRGISFLMSGSWYQSGGLDHAYYPEFDAPATNGGVADRADGDEAWHYFGMLKFQELTLEGLWSSREKTVPTAPWSTDFNSRAFVTLDERAYASLKYQHAFGEDHGLEFQAYYDDYYYNGTLPFSGVINEDRSFGKWCGTELLWNWTLTEHHALSAGAELRNHIRQDQQNWDRLPGGEVALHLDDARSPLHWAVYGQWEWNLRTNLQCSVGGRFDQYDAFGDTANPRLGLIFAPLEGTSLKALYGTAFRAPNAYEAYYHDGYVTSRPSRDLRPETIDTYELVLEQRLPWNLRFTTSAYHYTIHDLIDQTTGADGLLVFENLHDAEADGLEFELGGRLGNGWHARISYALQRAEDSQTGSVLSHSPESVARASIEAPLYRDRVFAGVSSEYLSGVTALDGTREQGYALVHLTLFSRNLLPGLQLSASLYNVFNESYASPGGAEHFQRVIPQEGRSLRCKLSYRF